MGLTCLTCGHAGFTNAFVHCVACLDFVVHRYCLDVIPKTYDEYVHWLCADCELKKQHKHYKTLFVKALEDDQGHMSNKLSSHENEKEKTEDNQSKHPTVSDEKHAKENKRSMVEPAMETEQKSKKLRKECTSRETTRQAKSGNDSVLPKENEEKESDEKSLSEQPFETNVKTGSGNNIKEDGVTASSGFDNQGFEASSEARGQNDFAKDPIIEPYLDPEGPNEPQIYPIWRGCFEILEPNLRRLEGFVAHLARKACVKACDVACQFETVLQLEMVSRPCIWPKSFVKSKPVADNIALYFFPSKTSVYEYERLVQKMVDDDVALRAHVQNSELLLFPSTELPIPDWRLQEKFYMWGVFRGRQPVHSQSNKDLEWENVKNENTLKGVESSGGKKG